MAEAVHRNGSLGPNDILATTQRSPRPSSLRDKIELRVAMQDTVDEFVRLRRQELWADLTEQHPEWSQERIQAAVDRAQPEYQEYDPVVHLATMAVDHRNAAELRRQAASNAAEYVRPKLKSVEMRMDVDTSEAREQKSLLFDQLRGLLESAALAKRGATIDVTPNPPAPIVPETGDEKTPAADAGVSGSGEDE